MVAWIGLLAALGWSAGAQASDGTRSLSFFHTHSKESATITFKRNGQYDSAALSQLNWLLRDWRTNEPATMDPRLFDILWEVYRDAGSREPIHVVSAYRSPQTNAMLHRRSRAVSEHSQHMAGKAIDIRMPDVEPDRLRAVAMRLQHGGVGYYGSGGFTHVDTGSVRAWPRMTEDQLARLFPDGKTVHLPPSGKPLARYEEARAELANRQQSFASAGSGNPFSGLLASLFRGEGTASSPPNQSAAAPSKPESAPVVVASAEATAYAPLPPRRPTDPAAIFSAALASKNASLTPETMAADGASREFGCDTRKMPTGAEPANEPSRLLFSPTPVCASLAGSALTSPGAPSPDWLRSRSSGSEGGGGLPLRTLIRNPAREPGPMRFSGSATGVVAVQRLAATIP